MAREGAPEASGPPRGEHARGAERERQLAAVVDLILASTHCEKQPNLVGVSSTRVEKHIMGSAQSVRVRPVIVTSLVRMLSDAIAKAFFLGITILILFYGGIQKSAVYSLLRGFTHLGHSEKRVRKIIGHLPSIKLFQLSSIIAQS